MKKPSLKGMKNCEYLGRFSKDEFIQQGHNSFGAIPVAGGIAKPRLSALGAARALMGGGSRPAAQPGAVPQRAPGMGIAGRALAFRRR